MEKILNLDAKLLVLIQDQAIGRYVWLDFIIKSLAVWPVYLVPVFLIGGWFWSAQTKRVMFKAGLAGVLAWMVFSKIIAAIANRPRPDLNQIGGKELIFHRPDTSFPSDHTAAIFAVALTFKMFGHRKLGNFFIFLGVVVGLSRILVGVHYPLDIIAGAVIGIATARLIYLLRNPIDKRLTEPFVGFMKKLHL